MKRFLVLVPAVLLVVLVARAQEDAAKKELQKLNGAWVMVSGERDGVKLADEHVKKSTIAWKGKDVVVVTPHQSKEPITAAVALDPTKKPAEMEWTRTNGPDAGKKMLAIYEFIGDDQYRICFAPGGKERPKDFSTKAGSGHMLHVWKRAAN